MISAQDLCVRLGPIDVLHGIDLQVEPGQLVTLVGPNGAGKTTALRALSRLVPISRGSVRFNGADISAMPPHLVARSGLVHVPQGRQIIPTLSVEDNLLIGARWIPQISRHELSEMLEREFQRFPVLRLRRHAMGGTLSGGEQQMLTISRALMMKPKVLMLDEPSLGLAPQIVSTILNTLKQLTREGISVLLVEQAALLALRLADFGYVLQRGRVVLQGPTDELLKDRQLVERYLG